jgi:hypothetical protein
VRAGWGYRVNGCAAAAAAQGAVVLLVWCLYSSLWVVGWCSGRSEAAVT